MVYELHKYDSFDSFRNEDDYLGLIVWETDEALDDSNFRFCGKLVTHFFDDSTVYVPDGFETLGYSFLSTYFWGGWNSFADTVYIPASVKTIEEGAFVNSTVSNIIIDPESPCGIIKDNGLYTKDGKSLIWITDKNTEKNFIYVVPEGVTRIGAGFCSADIIREVIIPSSVVEMGYDEENSYNYKQLTIKAPMGSYAIEFAKEHGINYEEIE